MMIDDKNTKVWVNSLVNGENEIEGNLRKR